MAKQTEQGTEELAARLRLSISRMARRLRQEAGVELSPSQTGALATIEKRGPLTPSELAAIEVIQRPTATRILAHLSRAGLVERTQDPTDGRSSLISATRDGRDLLRRLRLRKNEYLARRLRRLEADETATLERAAEILERMLDEGRG